MIQDGAIEDVDAVIALHVDPHTPGTLVVSEDCTAAGADTFTITINSKGGHGACPDTTIDPIFLSGHLILALNGIVSRRVKAFEPAVLTIGAIHAGNASNVITTKVELTGTIRYMDDEVQKIIHAEVEKAVNMIRALGGECDLKIAVGYPPGYNDGRVIKFLHGIAAEMVARKTCASPAHDGRGGFRLVHAPCSGGDVPAWGADRTRGPLAQPHLQTR